MAHGMAGCRHCLNAGQELQPVAIAQAEFKEQIKDWPAEKRDAFAADPERYLRQANARWPQLEQGLSQ